MTSLPNKQYILEMDPRIRNLTDSNSESKVTEEQFSTAIKGYKFDEFIILLTEISAKLFDPNFTENNNWKKEKTGLIVHKATNQYVTDFAIEYITNILLISGSNNFKRESIKNKDNIIGIFNIYHNSLVQPIAQTDNMLSLLIPLYFQQLTSQGDLKDAFTRQWLIFNGSQEFDQKTKLDLNLILLKEIGLTINEYFRLNLIILAAIITKQRFNFETFTNSSVPGMEDILNTEKISAILNQLSTTRENFVKLDNKFNSKLKPEFTKSRYNPLWEKPIIKIGENDYIVPCLSAYLKGALRGLYWIFENANKKTFRDHFGNLFEKYCGMVIQDIFGAANVSPGIKFGKENQVFFDWIVNNKNEVILFESKGYQFPLATLQTGDSSLVKKEILDKLVETIRQMYRRYLDIKKYEELKKIKDKKITIIGLFYDIPFVSTNMYDAEIKLALNSLNYLHPGIKDFKYIFLSIEELENYYYIKDYMSIESLSTRVKNTPGAGVSGEINMIYRENNSSSKLPKNLLDRKFVDFYNQELGIPYSEAG